MSFLLSMRNNYKKNQNKIMEEETLDTVEETVVEETSEEVAPETLE